MLDLANVVELLRRVKSVLKAQPNVVYLNVTTRLTVVGDLHGQLDDLLAIFKLNGLPSPRNSYLFNGQSGRTAILALSHPQRGRHMQRAMKGNRYTVLTHKRLSLLLLPLSLSLSFR